MKLYKYQEDAVHNAVKMLFERGNTLIVAGTGAGKTIMMAATIGRFIKSFSSIYIRKPHILVLVHRTEIHDQNHTKFSKVCPDVATSEVTAVRKSLHGIVHFGMVQTVVNLLDDFAKARSYFDLIVIDEAHHAKASTYEEIINWNRRGNRDACLFGVTATPNRGDELPLIELFDNFNQITTGYLIESHYLVRPRFVDLSPVFLNEKGKEEKGHLSKYCKNDLEGKALIKSLCEAYLANKESGKSIIFAPTHDFCTEVYNILKDMGRNPAYLSLGIDNETRRSEIERFESGDCEELINVDICTEGYDYPALRNVVDFDTNGTHGQWVQKVGRVLRTAPGKTSCTVIDFGGNVELYPEGVETSVNLEGIIKKPKGERLCTFDFFKGEEDKQTASYTIADSTEVTPYNPPEGFETVSDKDFGIVYVACGLTKDCIIVGNAELYSVFMGDKQSLSFIRSGTFNECVEYGSKSIGEIISDERPISNIQVRLLAPEYSTMTLSWYGANCCICWKAWKEVISAYDKGFNEN